MSRGDYFRYIPPPPKDDEEVIFSNDYSDDYLLKNFSGLGSALVQNQSQKAPFQIGETFINTDITARVVSLSLQIIGSDKEDLNEKRAQLSRVMVIEPRIEEIPELGRLQYFREGFEPLELLVSPVDSPQYTEIIPTRLSCLADIEFYAPNAYWRGIGDSILRFTTEETVADQLSEVTIKNFTETGENTNLVVYGDVIGTGSE